MGSRGFDPSPAETLYSPPQYTAPDWTSTGTVWEITFLGEVTGYLFWQDPDRITTLHVVDSLHDGYVYLRDAFDQMREGAAYGVPVEEMRDRLLKTLSIGGRGTFQLEAFTRGTLPKDLSEVLDDIVIPAR